MKNLILFFTATILPAQARTHWDQRDKDIAGANTVH